RRPQGVRSLGRSSTRWAYAEQLPDTVQLGTGTVLVRKWMERDETFVFPIDNKFGIIFEINPFIMPPGESGFECPCEVNEPSDSTPGSPTRIPQSLQNMGLAFPGPSLVPACLVQ